MSGKWDSQDQAETGDLQQCCDTEKKMPDKPAQDRR